MGKPGCMDYSHCLLYTSVRAIALAFYERTKIVEVTKEEFEEQEWEKDDLLLTLVYTKKRIQGWLKGKVGIEGTEERAVSEEVVCDYEDHKGSRNAVCRFLYRLFEKYTGRSLPWGMLTGIRPTKIIMKWMEMCIRDRSIAELCLETLFLLVLVLLSAAI